MLRCCFYHPVFSLEVLPEDNCAESVFQKKVFYGLTHFFVYLDENLASLREPLPGELAYRPVKEQGIVVGHEQGLIRLEAGDMGGHCGSFFQWDIGWVAYETVDVG